MKSSVSMLARGEERAWDAFVHADPMGTFFHLSGWKDVIERAFAHQTYYLMARRGDAVTGVLPLTRVNSPLFGDSLISNAFCVFGGPLCRDEEAGSALEAEAVGIARRLGVDHIEFRSQKTPTRNWERKSDLYVSFRRPIQEDLEANMKAIPRKQRAMVRKGISNGLTSVCDETVERLHDIYAQSVRNLGTPVFSKRYFALLKETFGKDCDIVTVLHEKRPVASVMNFYFRDEVLPYYGGGTSDARALAANDFMYWEVLRRAHAKGCKVFDFGRSKVGTGSYEFKRHWGFEPQPIVHEFFPVKSAKIPDVNPLNPKYAALIAVWRRLPLPVTKLIGPMIVRQIG